MSDFELNSNFNNGESNSGAAPDNENVSRTPETINSDSASFAAENSSTNNEEKAAKTPEMEPAEYTYSYGAFGTKENVTSRFESSTGNTYNEHISQNTSSNYTAGTQSTPYASGEGNKSYTQSRDYNPYSNRSQYTAQSYRPTAGNESSMHFTNTPFTPNGYMQNTQDVPPKENKNKAKTVKTSAAILLCVACVILSFAVSILGSAIAYKAMDASSASTNKIEKPSDGVVLYRDVETKTSGDTTVADIVDTVADSVVEITTEFVKNNNFFFGQYVTDGAGSGVIISEDGYIVTNNHVICDTENNNEQADKIKIRLRNGKEYTATVVGTDADADIALIKIDATELTAAVWGDSDDAVVGQQVIAVGNPLGSLGGTLTVGYISATSREIEIDNVKMTLIQTDAAVNPGNSGGGLFDLNGNLIGVVNAKSSGSGIEGLGFAIPSNDAKDTVEQLLEYGYVKCKVYIGVSFYEYNSGFYSSFGSSSMLMVYGTEEGYNDDVLQSGDIILTVDGKEVSTVADVKAILKGHRVGDKIPASILRNKTTMDIEIECFEYFASESEVSFEQ